MRMAKCLRGQFTVHGSLRSVALGPGWQGDLDQVVGRSGDQDLTLGAALGPHVTAHFEMIGVAAHRSPSDAPHQE